MRSLCIFVLFLIVGCTTPNPILLRNSFTFSKAYVELAYISRDKQELEQLLSIIETNTTPSKKFNEWDTKFEDEIKINVLKKYIKEGHKGL